MFFSSKYHKTLMLMLIFFLLIFGSDAFGADFFRYDHDIYGKIVDFDMRRPMKGVVVSAIWYTEHIRFSIEPERKYYDYFEMLTDEEGEFRIPGKGLNIIRNMPPPRISIFKAGYSILHLQDLDVYFRRDHPLSDEVKWVDGKAIIPFQKKSVEGRKKYLRTYPAVPFSGMTFAGVTSEKVRLFLKELKRKYEAVGMIPRHLIDQPYLWYQTGGVFPAEENSVKPKSLE